VTYSTREWRRRRRRSWETERRRKKNWEEKLL